MFRPFGTQGTDLVAAKAFPTVTLADPLRLLIVCKRRHGIRSLAVSSSLFRLLSQSLSRFPSPISVLFFSRPRFFSLSLSSPLLRTLHSAFSRVSALNAEDWTAPEGSKWVEKDFEADIKKLEKEAEERLDDKIAQLKGNVASVGKSD